MAGVLKSDHPAGAQSMLRSLNARAVLETIAGSGPLTRADIARQTGLSKPTVTVALTSLMEHGAVRESGHVTGRKGPVAVLYAVDPRCAWAVGVDLGHDRVRVAVADVTGEVRGRGERLVPRDPVALVREVVDLASDASAQAGIALADVTQLVVGVPAVVGPDGRTLSYAEGLPAAGRGLGQALAEALPAPVLLENDVNLAALAEQATGHGVGLEDFLLVSLGYGLGLGIVIGGRLHRGAAGAAGEAGYLPGPADTAAHARPPLRRDLLEHSIGARYITARGRALGLGEQTPKAIFELARAGDRAAMEIVDETAGRIAYVIACAAPLIDPELVVLGGAIGANGDLLLDPVSDHLAGLSPFRPRIVSSALGADAVLLGATAKAGELAKAAAFAAATVQIQESN
jgi:predicted NBD/HSP70 family sugar kinase